jgi:Abnormal spindle-like microcephaly-assoc'd, ASPM-SPD-2-Hydin/zinc-ribbon domain/HYDIN/CFA65/VesB-like, Ig-like domain
MIVCTKCGTENPEGTQFCRKCGGYLDWSGVKVAVQAGSAVTLALRSPDVTVDPGGQAISEVEINNDGRLVDEYRLQVSGVDPSWCSVEPPSIRLMPRTSGAARVLFRPPRASSPAAGTGPFVVMATSSADPAVRAQAAGSLTIRPFAELSAAVTPQTSQSVGVADHVVSVENAGNAAIRVTVGAQDPDNRLTCELAPPELTVEGGTIGRSQLSVRTTNPREPRTGQRVAFQVLVRPAVGAPIRLEAATVLLQRPASLWSRMRIPIAAAAVLLVAGAVVAYAGPPYPHWPPLPQAKASPSASAAPAVARVTVNPPTIGFGTVQVGAGSSAVGIAVANNGNAQATVTPTLSDSKNYTMQNLCTEPIGPSQQCQVQIGFNPKSEGSFPATLSFAVSSGDAPQAVDLSGQGQGHALFSCAPPNVAFNIILRAGVTTPSSTSSQKLTCTNTGTGSMAITSVVLQDTSGKFKIDPACGNQLAPGAACTVTVTFTTSTLGTTFTAQILFNDSLGQQIVPVSGYRGTILVICPTCTKLVISPPPRAS